MSINHSRIKTKLVCYQENPAKGNSKNFFQAYENNARWKVTDTGRVEEWQLKCFLHLKLMIYLFIEKTFSDLKASKKWKTRRNMNNVENKCNIWNILNTTANLWFYYDKYINLLRGMERKIYSLRYLLIHIVLQKLI